MNSFAQLRRCSSAGLGILSLALPFVIFSVDTAAAPPGAASTPDGDDAPAKDRDETGLTKEEVWARKHRNIKLNYINASWSKVLQDFAEATQTEVVADRVPAEKFSRWDMKFYNRDEALAVLNTELKPHNYRLQIKGHYLVLNALHEFRQEYAPALLRGERPQPLGIEDVRDAARATAHAADEGVAGAQRTAQAGETRSKQTVKRRKGSRGGAIRQVSADEDAAPEGDDDLAARPPRAVVTTLRISERDAVTVAKIIYKAFKPDAELVDDGPRGLQGFLVRKQLNTGADRKRTAKAGGRSTVKFSIGIDEKKNELIVEATPDETRSIAKLIKALDVAPHGAEASVRAVGTSKDADKLAAALRPELNRLASETRRTAQQSASAEGEDEIDDGETPADEQPAAPRRAAAVVPGRPNVPQALQRSLKGEVRVESIPELGILVLIGNDDDVQAVMSVIQEIEKLSAATTPEVKVAFLRHVSSETLAALLTSVYERLSQARNSTVQQSQAISVFPVARPNAILIVASKADLPSVYDLIDELDQPSDPAGEFRVFRLKYAVPRQIVENVESLYPPQQQAQGTTGQQNQQPGLGLVPRVKIIDDLRTNSVIVQARPRDMKEVALLISELDVHDTDSEQTLQIFRIEYGVAEEISATVSAAIQAVLAPSRATTVQQQGAGQQGGGGGPTPGGGQGAAGAGGGQGSSELREVKSAILKFRNLAGPDGRELRSGILADIRMTPDFRTNSIMVTAPDESMELVAALIRQLDRPPAAVAEIKIFKLKNSDATSMQNLLSTMFGIQRTGQAGQQGGGAGVQGGAPGLLVSDAEDSSSMLIPLRFSVDVRTNSITAVGGAAALNVVESILLTLDESDIRQRQNEVYRLKNVPAQTVATAISQFLQTQRQVLTADPGLMSPFEQIEREVVVVPETVSNSLLISATPRYFNDIKKVILQLDQSPRQVLIQALFIEVNLDNIDEFGMEFGAQNSILFQRSALTAAPQFITTSTLVPAVGTVSTQNIISESAVPGYLFNGQQLGNNTTPNVNPSTIGGQIGTGLGTLLTNSTLGYPGLLLQAGSENLNLLLRALSYRNRVDILSRPMIRTVDNQTANIQVGAYVPIINGFNANATTGVNSPIVQQRQIGIILQVTPRITPDGLVVMEVIARKDQLAPTGVPLVTAPTGTVTSPIINTQNALTTIAVPNGQTVVLGGMITKNDNLQERKVPLLGDIPLLGQAFRYDFKETQRTELIIFLTPRIIHNDEEAEMFKEIEIGRLNFIESEAERIHGPLHGVFASPNVRTDPHYGPPINPRETPEAPQTPPPPRSGILPPPPPEPGLPGNSADIPQIPQPLPLLEDDAGNGTTRRRNDDEEDLDAAFIQAHYRVPQKGSDGVGKAGVKKSATKKSTPQKSGSNASNSTKKTRTKAKTDDDQSPRMQRFAPDDQ